MRGGVASLRRPVATSTDSASRTEILDAAAEAFMQKGFAATSIDDVCDLLGATKGRVYHHYRSKTDLFFDVHLRGMEMDLAAVQEAAQQEGAAIDRLRAMASAHITVIIQNFAYQRVAVQGLEMHLAGQTTEQQRATLKHILNLRDKYEKLFSDTIEEAIREGAIPHQNVRIVVKAFFGALNWTTLWYRPRRNQSAADRKALADTIVDFAMSGLRMAK
ncbi:TetR/AcrR family transcriptional regulator [Enterovirga aerilata]|uniref:TetR/AcrR family transcriptional regulator n=1 Tax=Enterovirga aerilata TaxID=2730920 RepID=A0A849HVP0_9HYPH|nr:TetR/AcrR family transcriptional regulator [Enterovirga sp. DB1703]NNM71606.1 TetR/AcrR family transcriptional regulator [Enterovirga sp. DB1703]